MTSWFKITAKNRLNLSLALGLGLALSTLAACSFDGLSKDGKKGTSEMGATQGAADAKVIRLHPMICDCERVLDTKARAGFGDATNPVTAAQNDCSYVHPDGDSQTLLSIEVYNKADAATYDGILKIEMANALQSRTRSGGQYASSENAQADGSYQRRAVYFNPTAGTLIKYSEKLSAEAARGAVKPVGTQIGELFDAASSNSAKVCQ